MQKTQYFTASSLDGFIADADNSLDWLFQADAGAAAPSARTEAPDTAYEDFFAQVGALAMGATTYEWILGHEGPERWPYGQMPCWVFSHRQLPAVPGAPIRYVSGDVRPVHSQMTTAAGGRNIWLVGGGDLVGQFADQGMLDEILVSLAPATLGAGAPLLPRRLMPGELTLTGCRQAGALVHLSYAVRRLS